jgi:hypothetical protein
MGLCDDEVKAPLSEPQYLLDETKRALQRWEQTYSAFTEMMEEVWKHNKSVRDTIGGSLRRKADFAATSLAEAEKTKRTIDEVIAKAASPAGALSESHEHIVEMLDGIATISKETSAMALGLQMHSKHSSNPTASIIPIVTEMGPTTSVEILGNGQAFLAIDGVTKETGGYTCRLLLGDGTEFHLSGFSIEGIVKFIQQHREIFGVEEVIFRVLVTVGGETKIARKFGWKLSEKRSLQQSLEYCLFYLV